MASSLFLNLVSHSEQLKTTAPQFVLLELLHQLLVGEVNLVEVVRLLVVGVGVVELDQLDIFLPHTALTGSLRQVQGEEMLGIFARLPSLLLRLGMNQPGQAGPQSVSGRDFQQEDDIGQHLCNLLILVLTSGM